MSNIKLLSILQENEEAPIEVHSAGSDFAFIQESLKTQNEEVYKELREVLDNKFTYAIMEISDALKDKILKEHFGYKNHSAFVYSPDYRNVDNAKVNAIESVLTYLSHQIEKCFYINNLTIELDTQCYAKMNEKLEYLIQEAKSLQ